MIRRLLCAALTVALLLPATAAASVRTLTVVNRAGASHVLIVRAERAVQAQINRQVRTVWPMVPPVRFAARGGWPIILRHLTRDGGLPGLPGILGEHSQIGRVPFALVAVGPQFDGAWGWTDTLSHETIEMLIDPNGLRTLHRVALEPADPVNSLAYRLLGVTVADFVTPRWYGIGRAGRFDWIGALRSPFTWIAAATRTELHNSRTLKVRPAFR